jgi:hypothetical protein
MIGPLSTIQFTGAGLLLPVEQHQPTVQVVSTELDSCPWALVLGRTVITTDNAN